MFELKIKIKTENETLTLYVQGEEELHRVLRHYLNRGYTVAIRGV